MKVIAIILGALVAGAIAVTVAINLYPSAPDNSKAMEMQRKDIEAMRARAAAAAGQMQSAPTQWGGDTDRK